MSCTRSNPPNGYTAENRTSTTLQNRTTSPALERAMVTIAHQDNVLQPTNKLSFISPLQPHQYVTLKDQPCRIQKPVDHRRVNVAEMKVRRRGGREGEEEEWEEGAEDRDIDSPRSLQMRWNSAREDEIEAYYRKKYADTSDADRGYGGDDVELSEEIAQQALLPGVKDKLGHPGSGCLIKFTNGIEKINRRNPDFCSVFRSELIAIYEALKSIRNTNYQYIWILTDSRSAIRHLSHTGELRDKVSRNIIGYLQNSQKPQKFTFNGYPHMLELKAMKLLMR
ncbi:SUPT5H [Cordylochernes scorpioides]|uniref:SUPT5H n=1 Tax=Cordylochernes scorpioides TaxID=51811 RepID=A0ABY6LE51_9ARAC|nr:SUPT5H [Cordylochernes scorpioides]